MKKLRLAILDLYDGIPNQGMRCIHEIVAEFSDALTYEVFDVRSKAELPDTSFDIYITSGGPGDPLEGDGVWDRKWYALMDDLWNHNLHNLGSKKYVFFICHSFQMICHHFDIAKVCDRNSKAFGTFPIHKTREGGKNPILKDLGNPFWGADFRDYQVIQANWEVIDAIGAKILAREKIRPHVPFERAIMAISFSDEFFGTQFHPEADALGMKEHFQNPTLKETIIKNHSEAKYLQMMEDLEDPSKINTTHQLIIPRFIRRAIKSLQKEMVLA